MSDLIVEETDSKRQTVASESPISLRELKQAADKHFGARYTICDLKHDKPLVAMLCDMSNPYSPVTTWLYVGKDEDGRHYIAKRRAGDALEDVELTKLLTESILNQRKGIRCP